MGKKISRQMIAAWVLTLILIILCSSPSYSSETSDQNSDSLPSTDLQSSDMVPSLAEIDRRLNNPLTSIWSLTSQENFSLNKGNRVDETDIGNTFFFQPALPIPIGTDMTFMARPVFPLVTNSVLDHTREDWGNC